MGLTRRRALLAVATALVLVATTACTDDGEDPSSDGTTTTVADQPAPDGSGADDGIGGSRYLALVRRTGERFEVVVEDLVDGGEEVVRIGDHGFSGVAVSADGLVAWEESIGDDAERVSLAYDADQDPIEVEAPGDVGCPHWRDSGTLLVTLDVVEPHLALVDPTTGIPEVLPVDFDSPGCPAPAGPDHVVFARPLGAETFGPEGAEVVRAAIDGSGEEVVGHIPPGCWANHVAASPDGTRLAAQVLCGTEDAARQALHVGTMADDLHPLVAENPPDADGYTAYQYWSPTWSADGSVIAYHCYDPADGPDGTSHIWTIPSDGGEPEPHGSGPQNGPSFSPPLGGGRD